LKNILPLLGTLIVLVIFLPGCTTANSTSASIASTSEVTLAASEPTKASVQPTYTAVIPTQSIDINQAISMKTQPVNQPTLPAKPTATAQPTPTLGPDDWQNFPVIPAGVSEHAKEIYRLGIANGTNPERFSKIGDCQNINTYFLALFDDPTRYTLGEGYQDLQPAIDYYAGSWSRDSIAIRGGFNVASVFNPWFNNKELCDKNESPVDCELRVNRPSVVIISMETWWTGDATKYEGYLRKIVETVISYGAVPILATKADNVEGDHTINRSIARVAYEYDIPLWNFWRAVQPLPRHGIESDGFHITHGLNDYSDPLNLRNAWPTRNLTALQTINAVWLALQAAE
jgi:hypothetical protein